jgi:transcriptional regulator with XRE-family HTH domain
MWLIEARKACGLTQEQLARKLGVTRVCISNYERGIHGPETIKGWGVIADELGLSLDQIRAHESESREGRSA